MIAALMLAAVAAAHEPPPAPCETMADKYFSNLSITMGVGYSEGGNMPFSFGVEKYLEAGWAIGISGFFLNVDGSTYDVPVRSRSNWPTTVPFTTPSNDVAGVMLTVRLPL